MPPNKAPQPRAPQRAAEVLGTRIIAGLTHSELRQWGSSSKSARATQVRNELSGFKVRAGLTAFSLTEMQTDTVVPR